MTPEEIRQVVKITLDELDLRKGNYEIANIKVGGELRAFFNLSMDYNGNMFHALQHIKDDPYIDIIYSHYRDGLTLEAIADELGKDVSTIKRNKKRLILKINELLEL